MWLHNCRLPESRQLAGASLALKIGNLAAPAEFSTRAELTTATSGVLVNIYF